MRLSILSTLVFAASLVSRTQSTPVQGNPALPRAPIAAAASWGTVVINPDGTVVSWPEGSSGAAVPVALPMTAVQAAVHQDTAFVLLEDGSVFGWGKNRYESLGVANSVMGEYAATSTPTAIPGLRDITQIAATYEHAVAVRRDGAVFAWGESMDGLRGTLDPSTGNVRRPPMQQVPGVENIVQVATGARHSLALTRDGHVIAWGQNGSGELGAGATGAPRGPAPVVDLDQVVAIAAGGSTSFALKSDGSVWAWGWNQSGMIGNGLRPSTSEPGGTVPTPVVVRGVTRARAIVAGEGHAIALLADGTLRAWGHNGYGQIGNAGRLGYELSPITVPGVTGVTAISAGGYRSFAATSDGRLLHWGTPIPVGPGRPNLKVPAVLDR